MRPRQAATPPVQRIARLPRRGQEEPLGFAALREQALSLAQQASGELWTDYNLHDPGVTLLEALSYALTEDLYAAQASVPELLGLQPLALPGEAPAEGSFIGSVDQAGLARHALLPARQVLPCRPCTAADYRRWLHDQLPAARHLDMRCIPGSGLWQMRLLSPDGEAPADSEADDAAPPAAAAAAAVYWPQRNLGEDLLGLPTLRRPRRVLPALTLSVSGERDLVDLLGELMQRLDEQLAALPQLHQAAWTQEREGPALQQGEISDAELQRLQSDTLYMSDLVRALQGVEGLVGVQRLRLYEPGQSPALAPEALDWHDEQQALALQWPRTPAELSHWHVHRRDSLVQLPVQALLQHLGDLQQARQRLRLPEAPPLAAAAKTPAAQAEPSAYYPASAQLPPLYAHPALLRWNSDRAQDWGAGQQRQWLGYRALLELPLAQAQAQREHLGELYALRRDPARSYWWQLPDEAEMPGLQSLIKDGASELLRALDDEDPALERRGRALDHLLALHGEGLSHHTLQGLPCYLEAAAWARHLHALKCRLLEQVRLHTEQRHAGFDYSRASFERKDNTAPLQQRLSLMLGFAHAHSRSLCRALQEAGLQLASETVRLRRASLPPAAIGGRPLPPPRRPVAAPGADRPDRPARPALQSSASAPSARQRWAALALRLPRLLDGPVEPALLRSAAHWERYLLQPDGIGHELRLGPDEQGRHWTLARGLSADAAQALAEQLHEAACQLQFECEGLHLVEHLLLRPWGSPAAQPPDPWERQLSLVLPGWTARCATRRLRRQARDAVTQSAPAHLHCRLLWLDAAAMQRFEAHYRSWLLARQRHCEALRRSEPGLAALTRRLDERAAALAALLRQAGS